VKTDESKLYMHHYSHIAYGQKNQSSSSNRWKDTDTKLGRAGVSCRYMTDGRESSSPCRRAGFDHLSGQA